MTAALTPLAAKVVMAPDEARFAILDAFLQAGDMQGAAERLGVNVRTLYRYVARLELGPRLEDIRSRTTVPPNRRGDHG